MRQPANEMKSIIGHGNWLTYLQSQLPEISESTAQRYMKINFQKTAFQRAVRHRTLQLREHFNVSTSWTESVRLE